MNARTLTSQMLNDPFFIGFDRIVDRMRATSPGQTNYPPYNIAKTDEDHYELQIAIAGFSQADIDIEIKDGVLDVVGSKQDEGDQVYLHKGISARAFRRSFTLADTIVVKGADISDGILIIQLENVIPEEKKPRKIAIGNYGRSVEPDLIEG